MKSTTPIVLALTSIVAALSPFDVSGMTSHQPNGNPGGQVNYCRIAFSVNSTNSGNKPQSGYCAKFWGDNSWLQEEAYSVNVPTGQWISCDTTEGAYDGGAPFQFQLFPYFSIGNFSLAIKEDLGDGESAYSLNHITNKTSDYTCQINPQQLPYNVVHASGDCSQPTGSKPFLFTATSEYPTI
ncbi:hypothetical protein AC579_5526 [Pseudocercospora musae]|uniref:AA1-like domain-containing protein n=1 Tax=Pseudocercospora musae TaxID=113226 RepID=A0A139IMT6_9PEZI|nr:hypothetical protein AC579_5526 [Pseudocercospora musae]KXT15871.1 hypothetical protein AC579_5526 [Pseudocercospora musae]KXT15874.1 hypothetical protein AC579_5526 [Pseudocercospora musae]